MRVFLTIALGVIALAGMAPMQAKNDGDVLTITLYPSGGDPIICEGDSWLSCLAEATFRETEAMSSDELLARDGMLPYSTTACRNNGTCEEVFGDDDGSDDNEPELRPAYSFYGSLGVSEPAYSFYGSLGVSEDASRFIDALNALAAVREMIDLPISSDQSVLSIYPECSPICPPPPVCPPICPPPRCPGCPPPPWAQGAWEMQQYLLQNPFFEPRPFGILDFSPPLGGAGFWANK